MVVVKKRIRRLVPKITFEDVKGKFPISIWLPQYNFEKLQGDIIAGLAVGLMVVPQSLALASLAGVNPEYGLYSSFPGVFAYAILGTARDMNVGPTVMLSLLTKRYISFASVPAIASALAFICGIILLFLGIFKLGFLVRFISTPVTSGFVSAAAIIIAVSQLKDMFGLKNAPRPFFERLAHFFTNVKNTIPGDASMGIACLAFLIGLQILGKRKWKDKASPPKWKIIARKTMWFMSISRSALVAILATIVSYIFHLYGYSTVFTLPGHLPEGLPPFKFPMKPVDLSGNKTVSVKDMISGFGSGIGIVPLIIFIESIAVAKALSRKNNYKIDASQELVALGVGNVLASFFAAFPVTGSFSRSAVNSMSGARTPLSSVITGSVVLLAIAFITPVFKYIPKAALGAMVFAAVLTMIEFKMPKKLWKINRLDLLPFTVSFMGCFYELEVGVLAGTGVAIVVILYRVLNPRTVVRKDDESNIITLEMNGGTWFPAAENVAEKLLSMTQVNDACPIVIQIDCKSMYEIDYTVAMALRQVVMDIDSRDISMCKPEISFINVEGRHVKSVLRKVGLLPLPLVEDQGSNDEVEVVSDGEDARNPLCYETAV